MRPLTCRRGRRDRENASRAISVRARAYNDLPAGIADHARPRTARERSRRRQWRCGDAKPERMQWTRAVPCDPPRQRLIVAPSDGPNAAKLEFALHAAQLRIGDRFDRASEIEADPPQRRTRTDACAPSWRPAKPVAGRCIAVGEIVSHLKTPMSARDASMGIEDARDGIGNRDGRARALIAAP